MRLRVYMSVQFRSCMVKQMLYIGKAPKGKIPHIWHFWNIKIPKPPYISTLWIIGSLHLLIVLGSSEKNYLWQSLWITLYFFGNVSSSDQFLHAGWQPLCQQFLSGEEQPYELRQILMNNIKILFPSPQFLRIKMKRFDKTIEEDWAFGEDCKCFFPISNVRVTNIKKKWDQNSECIYANC